MRISTRQLQAFLVVAEVHNFTRAAETLHVTQAGLSAMINELEAQVDIRLFERTSRSVALTPAGMQFLPYARQAVESLGKGVMELTALNRRQQGGIRVGVSPLIASTVLPAVVREFQQCTGRSCEIVDAELEVLHEMVEVGRLDAAYGTYVQRASRLKSDLIFGMALQLACPRELMPAGAAITQAEDWASLRDVVLCVLPDANAVQQVVNRYLLEAGAHMLRRQEVHHMATMVSFISAGMGMGFVPTFLSGFYDHDVVGHVNLPLELPVVDFYCTRDASNPASSSIRVFSRLLATHCHASTSLPGALGASSGMSRCSGHPSDA